MRFFTKNAQLSSQRVRSREEGTMKVLVVGGSGYLGHRVVKAALDHGHEVVAISRGITNKFSIPPKASHLLVDRNDAAQMQQLARDNYFDAMLDVVPYSRQHVDIVAEAFGSGIKKYVSCSSMAVYGIASYYPTDESHPRDPFAPWAGKVEAEDATFDYGNKHGVGVTILRAPYIIGEKSEVDGVVWTILTWD